MNTTAGRTDQQVAAAFEEDLWNEHHYQITATFNFYAVLHENGHVPGVNTGDEGSLSSALIHTRSLLEFYSPKGAVGRHPSSIWWATALGFEPRDDSWKKQLGKDWPRLDLWWKPIHVYLGHLSWDRRSLQLPRPADKNDQRWPLLDFTIRCRAILDRYVEFVRSASALSPVVVEALESVQQKTQDEWVAGSRLASDRGVGLCCTDDAVNW